MWDVSLKAAVAGKALPKSTWRKKKKKETHTYTKNSFKDNVVLVFLVFQTMFFVKLHLDDAKGEVPYSGFIHVSL